MDRVSDKWLEDVIGLHELGGIGSELDHAAFCELRDRRAADTMRPEWHHADEPAEREQAGPGFERVFTTYSDAWHRLAETDSASAPKEEQAAPDAEQKPSFVGVDLASGPDRTEVWVIRLRKRPRWLRELLSDWERRACDLVAQGRSFDAEDLRAGAEEVRKAHDGRSRKPAKWERRMKEAQIILWPPCIAGQNQTDKWIAHIWAMGEWSADTAKAAVKAAWRAWKEAKRE